VFESYFINMTNKPNLIDGLLYDLIRFFDHLVVAYIFGPPCIRWTKTLHNITLMHISVDAGR